MTAEDKLHKDIYDIISGQFLIPKENITSALGPGDLDNWDSIGHLQLVRKLEQHFNVSFTVPDVMSFDTVKDIYDTIKGLLA